MASMASSFFQGPISLAKPFQVTSAVLTRIRRNDSKQLGKLLSDADALGVTITKLVRLIAKKLYAKDSV